MSNEKSAYQVSQVSLLSEHSKHSDTSSLTKEKHPDHPDSKTHSLSASTPTLVGSITPYPAESSSTSGGHRLPIHLTHHLPRGVVTRTVHVDDWLSRIQTILNYTFTHPDLLEEALESPGSGIHTVGKSHRQCPEGNKSLAAVGKSAMKLALKDVCYTLRMNDSTSLHPLGKGIDSFRALMKTGSTARTVANILGWRNLDRLGRVSGLEQFVRPRMRPAGESRGKRVLLAFKDDFEREDPTRTVARAVEAVVGAVYFDGGFEAVRVVMEYLDLVIRVLRRQETLG